MLSQLRTTWGLAAAVLAGLVVILGVGFLLLRPPDTPKRTTDPERPGDEVIDQAQDVLAKATDAHAIRPALQEINLRLTHHPEHHPEPLTEEQRGVLTDAGRLGLGAEALREVENPNYTLFDGHYLELCFLLQDVLRSLDLEGLSQPEQAAAAFAWVVRQLRLVERDEGLQAPEFVLHRGWGTARQRALVFLELLRQLGIPGCALAPAGGEDRVVRPWACGALVTLPGDKKEVLLFDPRLGLPLPGAKATSPDLAAAFRLALPVHGSPDVQPASLAALRRQPNLLQALTVDEKHPYDVTADGVRDACIYLAPPLSALAPRMKYLQDELHELPSVRSSVRLAADAAADLAAWQSVAGAAGGTAPPVRFWKEATTAQFWFYPPEEGGTDQGGGYAAALRELIAWNALPPQIANLEGEPGQRLMRVFNVIFLQFILEPGTPPDLMLHGRQEEAASALVQVRDELREQKARLAAASGLDEKVRTWSDEIIRAQADVNRANLPGSKDRAGRAALDQARARLDEVWKTGEEFLLILVQGRTADVQLPDATYLLAQCKQEQAERLQRALDRARSAGRAPATADEQAAREAWADASSWWDQYAADLAAARPAAQAATRPGQRVPRGSGAAARLLRARASQALDEADAAGKLLTDLSGGLTEPEQTARLYLARQLTKP
jgi:hypothetical protein